MSDLGEGAEALSFEVVTRAGEACLRVLLTIELSALVEIGNPVKWRAVSDLHARRELIAPLCQLLP